MGVRVATQRDVAVRAGVSASTVSHYINGTRAVEPATGARVREAIDFTGYAPNRLARALRRASTESIGLVVSDIGNPFYTDVIRGIEDESRRRGMTVLLANSDDDPARELSALRALLEHRVDGLIVALASGTSDSAIEEIASYSIPVVLVDRLARRELDQVGTENREATEHLVSHLVERGHRRVAFLSGIEGISTSDERLIGYRAALRRAGVDFDPALVMNGQSRIEPAAEATRTIMTLRPRVTALVAGNNLMALGALKALTLSGLRVPEDVALVSFDDFEWADILRPRLTTMSQPSYEIGIRAMRLLLRRLENHAAPPRTLRLKPIFRHRDSCGCPGPESNP